MPVKKQDIKWDHFPIVLDDWDASYHFGLAAGKYDTNRIGTYSESQVIVMQGKVFGTHKELNIADGTYVQIHTFAKKDTQLESDSEFAPASGIIELDRGKLNIIQSILTHSLGYMIALLSSGKVQAATVTASRLKRNKGFIRGVGLYTYFSPEDWQ